MIGEDEGRGDSGQERRFQMVIPHRLEFRTNDLIVECLSEGEQGQTILRDEIFLVALPG